MKRPSRGSTVKQYAYATRLLSGGASSKREAALLSGYSMTMAKNTKAKIENTEGFNNAIAKLAADSNNLLIGIIAEFKARGLDEFTNKELIAALNAMSNSWEKIDKRNHPEEKPLLENPLRAIFTERTRTVEIGPAKESAPASVPVPSSIREAVVVGDSAEKIDMDF